MLGTGAPVATQGPLDAVPRKPASSLLSVPCPAGVCLLCSLSELAGALEHGSPPVPSPRPFGGSVPQVTLLPGDSTWPALAVRARLASQTPVPAYGGKSWVTPGLWYILSPQRAVPGSLGSQGAGLCSLCCGSDNVRSLVVVLLLHLHPLLYFLTQFSFHKLLC